MANFGFGGTDALRFSGSDIYTDAELDALNKKPEKEKEIWRMQDALGQLINSALAGARSLDELDDAALGVVGSLGNQWAQNRVGGLEGLLLGGGIQFLTNLLSFDEQRLPINDGALDVRLVEIVDDSRDLTARRDSGQLSYQAERRRSFDSLALGA